MSEAVEVGRLIKIKRLARAETGRVFETVEIDRLTQTRKLARVETERIETDKLTRKTCRRLRFVLSEIMRRGRSARFTAFHSVKCSLSYVLQVCESLRSWIIHERIQGVTFFDSHCSL